MPRPRESVIVLTEHDIYLFREGTHSHLYDKLGCHVLDGAAGANLVYGRECRRRIGNRRFERWSRGDPLAVARMGRLWEGSSRRAARQAYKYRITSNVDNYVMEKADPLGFLCESPPATASRVWCSLTNGTTANGCAHAPSATVWPHRWRSTNCTSGSWRRKNGRFLSYRELAVELCEYLNGLGFTHVELMPLRNILLGSWGYQTTWVFRTTARYGTPQDLMYFVEHLHRHGIGVILDWVPSHFPTDAHGLVYFDGTHLYEHAMRARFPSGMELRHIQLRRNEVRAFSCRRHCSGSQVSYRWTGAWTRGLHAVSGLRAQGRRMDTQSLRRAGEHRSHRVLRGLTGGLPRTSGRRHDCGGIDRVADGLASQDWAVSVFGMKWNMGWMHDTLAYMQAGPDLSRYHHGQLTFSLIYAFNENFVLPLSHDEVVYGKGA